MNLDEKKKRRLEYLKMLYDLTDGDRFKYVSGFRLGENLGFNKQEANQIVDYLVGEGLVQYVALGGTIAITHEGIKEVESGLENPKNPTEHFPPINVIQVGKMVNSEIQQSTTNSNQQIDSSKKIQLGDMTESKKKGYVAGVVSLLIGIIFGVIVFQLGWDMTGQILTAFSALFSLLGIGSLIKPESVGIVTSQFLENITKNIRYDEEEEERRSYKKSRNKRRRY